MRACSVGDPYWMCLLSMWLLAFTVVRDVHAQRLVIYKVTTAAVIMWCSHGKQRSKRSGFVWAVSRRFMCGLDWTLAYWPLYMKLLHARPDARYLFFDPTSLAPITMQSRIEVVRSRFAKYSVTLAWINSYTWRRCASTWGHVVQLNDDESLALGDWQNKPTKAGTSIIPLRYETDQVGHDRGDAGNRRQGLLGVRLLAAGYRGKAGGGRDGRRYPRYRGGEVCGPWPQEAAAGAGVRLEGTKVEEGDGRGGETPPPADE